MCAVAGGECICRPGTAGSTDENCPINVCCAVFLFLYKRKSDFVFVVCFSERILLLTSYQFESNFFVHFLFDDVCVCASR